MKKFLLNTLVSLSAITAISAAATPALAEVLIAPTRVVLENGVRSAELVVVNKGQEQAAFRVSVENRRMLENGALETADIAKSNELFAKDYIRFSPRRIVLEPGGRQTVRVSVNTSNLEEGEYRSHLRLMSAPMSAGRALAASGDGTSDSISIQLIAVRSLTIPVIARVGALNATVQIDNAALDNDSQSGETFFVARLNRDGTQSTYGDINLYIDGEAEPIYFARGIAVYTPNTHRDVILPLPEDVRAKLSGQTIRMTYVSSNPAKPEVYADYTTTLN